MSRLAEVVAPARFGTGFRWLLASFWASQLGDGIAGAAGPLLLASLTADPFLISLAALLHWAPPLVFGLYAGALSDRLDRRRIIMIADGLRGSVLVVLIAALLSHHLSAGGALVALAVLATGDVFADNPSQTLAPMLVHRDDLPVANARIFGGFVTLNQLAGAPIGAALFAAGRFWPFATEAVLVCAGVLLVSRVVLPAHGARGAATDGGLLRDVADAMRWTVRHGAVRTLVLTILIFNVTFGAAWSVLVVYAHRRLGLGPVGYGLTTTVTAAGGLVGSTLYGWITRRVSLGNLMRVGLIIETLTHLALALATSPWAAGPVFFLFGAHAFIWGTTSLTIRQRAVPIPMQGRVNSVNTISTYGGLVVGSVIGGILARRFGVTAPFWFAFVGSAIFVVLLWRELSRIAHEDA